MSYLTHFAHSLQIETVTKKAGYRSYFVFDFRALWRSALSARVPESQKQQELIRRWDSERELFNDDIAHT